MTDDNLKYKTGQKRFWAALIDGLVFIPFALVDMYVRSHFYDKPTLCIWVAFMTVLTIVYSVFFHYRYGRTLGKWVVGVKVVNIDETKNITLKQSLLRDSFYVILETLALIYLAFQMAMSNLTTIELLDNFDSFGGTIALIWVLLELVSMLTNDKRRAVHDFIAGSVVIRTDNDKG